MARLNVAMVAACPFPYPRGTPTRVYRIAEAVAQRGHKVDVITYHLGEKRADVPFSIHRTRPVSWYKRFEAGPTYGKLGAIDTLLVAKLLAFVRNNRVDLIHAHHYEGLLVALPVSRLYRLPLLYDAQTLLEEELEYYGLGLPRRVKRTIGTILDRLAPPLASHVIAGSEHIMDTLTKRHGLAEEKTTIVPGGVEFDHFDYEGARASAPYTLIYTGNMAEFQGIEVMLKAFRQVLTERNDVRLVIVTGGNFAGYESLARELGIYKSIDLLPDDFDLLPRRLGQATIALYPRRYAGMLAQKLVNYMTAGCPIVSFASASDSLAHGDQLWQVKGDSCDDFAQGILHLLANPELATRLGDNARAYALANFSWRSSGKQIEETYRRILDKQQPVSAYAP